MAVRTSIDFRAGGRRKLVRSGKRPARGAVIKFAVGPDDSIVASGTERSGKGSGDVIRNGATKSLRAGPIGGVAAVAIGVS